MGSRKTNGKKRKPFSRRVAVVDGVLAGQLDLTKGVRLAVARKIIEELGREGFKSKRARKKSARMEGRKEANEEEK